MFPIFIRQNQYYLVSILLNGFITGLIFNLVAVVIPSYQLADAKYSLNTIGAMALTRLPYTAKVLWAPFIDRYSIPFLCTKLGQRRGWAFAAQCGLLCTIASLNLLNISPAHPKSILGLASIVFIISVFGSIQDIVFEAYRIEKPSTKKELASAIAVSNIGFRLAMFIGSIGSLYVASLYSWPKVYQAVFCLTLLGPLSILCSKEPNHREGYLDKTALSSRVYFDTLRKSLEELKSGQSYLYFLLVMLFLLLYKASDLVPMTMGPSLFFDLSFSKDDFAQCKFYGSLVVILGGILGGTLMNKAGISRGIWMSGAIQVLAPLMFMLLSLIGHYRPLFIIAIVVQHFCSGLGSTALNTYLAGLCNSRWSATQAALISSISSMVSIILAFSVGYIAKYLSWSQLFFSVALLGIIAVLLFPRIYHRASLSNHH